MKDALTSLVTNLHILALALLLTGLGLGVVKSTPDSKAASGEHWQVIITTGSDSPTNIGDTPQQQPMARTYTPSKARLPW